jgi:hypothetical protein
MDANRAHFVNRAMSNSADPRAAAPVVPDPCSRGFDREFRLLGDAENVIRINQRQPQGLPRKLAEFVPVAGITKPDVVSNAQAFVYGTDRRVELCRIPDHPIDCNAIAVVGSWVSEGALRTGPLGYVPAVVAAEIATLGSETPIGATIKVMYTPAPARTLGIRLDVWGPRQNVARAVEQPYAQDAAVPTDAVERNLKGIELESQGLIDNAIECYEANVRDGFDGNHPYDRLAIIHRRRGEVEKELAVLQRAIGVFERLQGSPRSDVAPKLAAFRQRYQKAVDAGRRG